MPTFTFKKEPRETGLRAVGHPHQGVNVKRAGKCVGFIHPPGWHVKRWRVMFTVCKPPSDADPCPWAWIELGDFADEAAAREFVKTKAEKLLVNYTLHEQEEE